MIAFRVDANKFTATGHAMRCMSIADALMEQGEDVVFIVADDDSRNFIASRGFRTEIINSDWRNMDAELPVLFEMLERIDPSWLIISSYQTTDQYLSAVTSKVKTMFFDDFGNRTYPASAVVNYNIYAERIDYSGNYTDQDVKLLLGPEYAPLRKQFKEQKRSSKQSEKSILVSVGGTDNYGLAQRIIEFANEQTFCDDWVFHILSGHFGGTINVPTQMKCRVIIHKNVTDMAALMSQCSVAITAGGSTFYELCACGVPSVSYSLSDDQLLGAKEFDRLDIIPYCGDIRKDIDKVIQTIFDNLNFILGNKNVYESHSEKMQQIVDGQGSDRIAAILNRD